VLSQRAVAACTADHADGPGLGLEGRQVVARAGPAAGGCCAGLREAPGCYVPLTSGGTHVTLSDVIQPVLDNLIATIEAQQSQQPTTTAPQKLVGTVMGGWWLSYGTNQSAQCSVAA
jgi:hypothetical protein